MKIHTPQIVVGDVLELGYLVDIEYPTDYDWSAGEYWGEAEMCVDDVTVESIEVGNGDYVIWVRDHSTNVRGRFSAPIDSEYEKRVSVT